MTTRVTKLLWDIRNSVSLIRSFVGDRTLEAYLADAMLRSAVERQFEIVGESARRLREESPDIFNSIGELGGAIAFRNFLIHVYDAIDHRKVWEIIESDLPKLCSQIDAVFAEKADDAS